MHVMIDGVRYIKAQQDEVELSILVPSVSSRRATFAPKIAEALFGQHEVLSEADRKRVEILMLTDAKGVLVGDKRNAMVRMARGNYVVFVDDDDRVTEDYIQALLAATKSDADCLVFHASVSLNGDVPKLCKYSKGYERDANAPDHYQRLPNHITAVKRVLALANPFPSKQCGEDADYAKRLRPLLKTEHDIGRVLYHYDFNQATTETQGKQIAAAGFTVDVVILSKATSPALRAMCQNAINSCKKGAGVRSVNISVIEQDADAVYDGAVIVRSPGDFNYNRSANIGARRGNAEWIMIANSDLIFQDGWLDALLAAGRDCVSPVDPSHRQQASVRHDEAGWVNGRNFSGWCFMLKRDLYDRMQGGFDECVEYWCSDNVVIEQCRALGVMPMVVAAARVQHIGGATLKSPGDDKTWAQVSIFNKKYNRKEFVNDPRYQAYLKTHPL